MPDLLDDARWPIEAARAADTKSGSDIVILNVGPVLAICGHFVIASAANSRLVRAIADEVEHRITERAASPICVREAGGKWRNVRSRPLVSQSPVSDGDPILEARAPF